MHSFCRCVSRVLAAFGFVLLFGGAAQAQIHWIETGHFYDVIPGSFTWDEAKADAESRVFLGVPGHLAAIATEAENAFITSQFDTNGAFLGGVQAAGGSEPAGGWSWITGEGFYVTRWAGGEPNNSYAGGLGSAPIGSAEAVLSYSTIDPTRWADVPRHPDVRSKYVIEWEPRWLNPSNGHYYVQVDGPFSWSEGRAAAEALTHLEVQGHLATITSAEENAWVALPPTVFRRLFNTGGLLLGGYQDPADPGRRARGRLEVDHGGALVVHVVAYRWIAGELLAWPGSRFRRALGPVSAGSHSRGRAPVRA